MYFSFYVNGMKKRPKCCLVNLSNNYVGDFFGSEMPDFFVSWQHVNAVTVLRYEKSVMCIDLYPCVCLSSVTVWLTGG